MLRIVTLATLVVVVGACPAERPPPLEPVKIGALNSLSGALASFGSDQQRAALLAAEHVSAAGGVFDGRPVEVITLDTEGNATKAAEQAQALVDLGVSAIVGPETSGQSGAVLAVASAAEIPMVSCCATSTELSAQNSAGSGYFFRTAPSDLLQGKAQAYLALNGVPELSVDACANVAFFARNDSYGDGFKTVFTNAYDGRTTKDGAIANIIAEGTFPTPNVDPSAQEIDDSAAAFVDAIEGALDLAGPNPPLCVVFITFGAEGAKLVGGIERGMQAMLTANAAMTLDYVYLTGDGAQEGAFLEGLANESSAIRAKLFGTVPFHAENAAYDQFVVAFEARYGTLPGAYTAQSFDSMFVTALALSQAKSTVGNDVRNALFTVSGRDGGGARFDEGNFFGEIAAAVLNGDSIDYVGPSGELTFDAFGDVQGDYSIWTISDDAGVLGFADRVPLPVAEFDPR